MVNRTPSAVNGVGGSVSWPSPGARAGIAAAVSAARTGCSILLLDKNPAPGGIGGFSGLTTLCGLYDDAAAGNEKIPRIRREPSANTPRQGRCVSGCFLVRASAPIFCFASGCVSTARGLTAVWNTPLAGVVVSHIVSLNNAGVRVIVAAGAGRRPRRR